MKTTNNRQIKAKIKIVIMIILLKLWEWLTFLLIKLIKNMKVLKKLWGKYLKKYMYLLEKEKMTWMMMRNRERNKQTKLLIIDRESRNIQNIWLEERYRKTLQNILNSRFKMACFLSNLILSWELLLNGLNSYFNMWKILNRR